MTFNDKGLRASGAALLIALLGGLSTPVLASLGENQSSIENDRMRMRASRAMEHRGLFSVHTLKTEDGSQIRQFVGMDGRVFAVRWNAMHKPDLSKLLGESWDGYGAAVRQAARRGGIQRQFHHAQGDVVVQSDAHLHIFSGYAYRRSLLPAGFSGERLAQE